MAIEFTTNTHHTMSKIYFENFMSDGTVHNNKLLGSRKVMIRNFATIREFSCNFKIIYLFYLIENPYTLLSVPD